MKFNYMEKKYSRDFIQTASSFDETKVMNHYFISKAFFDESLSPGIN